jgi:ribonuclease HI
MYFDGSLKLNGGGAGVLFISTKGKQLKYVLQILWKVSNNEDEYEALLHGLRLVISLGIRRYSSMSMDAYIMEVEKLENKFSGLEIHYVIQDHNVVADVLSKLGSTHA